MVSFRCINKNKFMNSKNHARFSFLSVGVLLPIGILTTLVSSRFMQANVVSSAETAPLAPAGLSAVYSTENMGQREVVLTVTDNATNETYYQLYWHLSGTAWPSTAVKDTYNSSTWSQPANVGRMQISAPTIGGTYEYQLQACNPVGCSSSNIALINVPGVYVPPSTVCTSLNFAIAGNKTSYIVGEDVNYSYKCIPEGTNAPSVTIQVVKPDGIATTYVGGGNIGAVLQQMGFSTSNLANGSYILRACLNDTSCATGVYSIPFTVTGNVVAAPPVPAVTTPPAPVVVPSTTTYPVTPSTTPPPTATVPQAGSGASTGFATPASTIALPATTAFPQSATTAMPSNSIAIPVAVPTAAVPATPATPFVPPILPALSGSRCTRYLSTIKSSLNSNDRTIRSATQKMKDAPAHYVNLDEVNQLLADANTAVSDAKELLKKKDCSSQSLQSIVDKQDDINAALENLSGFTKDELQYFSGYNTQCKAKLASRTKRISALIAKEKNKDTKLTLQDILTEMKQKSQEFAADAANAYFPEVTSQCKEYAYGIDADLNFYISVPR